MSRTRLALLLAVLVAVAAALGVGLTRSQERPAAEPSLAPLIARAALEPCTGSLALRVPGRRELPDISLPCLDGTGTHPLLFTGPHSQLPTMVNVYGSWCQPCATEMPLLRQLHQLAGPRLRLVGVDTEDDPRMGLLFAIDLGQRWPALRDDDGLVSRSLGGGAPKTVFVDGSGAVVHVQRGTYQTLAALRADVGRYLGLAL
ncbi:MAG: Thiol-disulfide isomerase-like thioredoxin [Frankiales bacterium]|nr:Thiol-disulfide isomerase-like thioredoxin [Frankiales bacterium]